MHGLHRISQKRRNVQPPRLQGIEHQAGGTEFHQGAPDGEIGVTEDKVQTAVTILVGQRLIAGVENGPVIARLPRNDFFHEVRTLRQLKPHRMLRVLWRGPDPPGTAEHASGDQKSGQYPFDYRQSRQFAPKGVVFVASVGGAAGVIEVVLDDENVFLGRRIGRSFRRQLGCVRQF